MNLSGTVPPASSLRLAPQISVHKNRDRGHHTKERHQKCGINHSPPHLLAPQHIDKETNEAADHCKHGSTKQPKVGSGIAVLKASHRDSPKRVVQLRHLVLPEAKATDL